MEDNAILTQAQTCALSPSQAHYLHNVLRRKADDQLRLFSPQHGEWLARITHISRKSCIVEFLHQTQKPQKSPPLLLAFAMVKGDVTKRLIRMGTEIGVTRFIPIITARTNTHRINKERLQHIIIDACAQCERNDPPEIFAPQELSQFLENRNRDEVFYVAIERSHKEMAFFPGEKDVKNGILVGPEGGFTSHERHMLNNTPHIQPFSLGKEILRADTACIVSLTLLKYHLISPS